MCPGTEDARPLTLGSRGVLAGSDRCAGAARAPTRLRGARSCSYSCTVFRGTILLPLHRPRLGTYRAPPHPVVPGALRSPGWAWSRGALAAGTPTAPAAGLGALEPDPRRRHPSPRLPDAARALVCRKGQNCDTEGRVLALDRVKKKNFWERNQKSPSLYKALSRFPKGSPVRFSNFV